MTMPSLLHLKCEPCEGGIPPMTQEEIAPLLAEIPGWILVESKSLTRELVFQNFEKAIQFINRLAEIAEQEGHHPDFTLHGWNKVTLNLSTHAIGGLSRNDFILAAKLNAILDKKEESE